MARAGATVPDEQETEQLAMRRARERARSARWDLNIAIFLFSVLIIVIILLFQGVPAEIVSPIAVFGLGMVWLVGWRQGRQLIDLFYEEELLKLKAGQSRSAGETIEERVQKALRERWR